MSDTATTGADTTDQNISPIGVQQQSKLERYLLRPLFVFITFVLVLTALVQASGRFTMATLHLFESEINALAETQGVSLRGLTGDWHYFNPVVRVAEVSFPGGSAQNVRLELDLLESAWHNALVARHLAAGDVALRLKQTATGWALDAPLQEQQFDPTLLLENSAEISARAQLTLTNRRSVVSYLQGDAVLRKIINGKTCLTEQVPAIVKGTAKEPRVGH